MSKKSKALGLHEPLRLQEHPAAAYATGIRRAELPHRRRHGDRPDASRNARRTAQRACDAGPGYPKSDQSLRHHHGRRIDPVHLLRSRGRRQHRRLERAGRRSEGTARFSHRSPATASSVFRAPWCRIRSTTGNFIDSSFGLRYHSDSAHLRGMKMRTSAKAMAGTNGTIIPALSQNDTNTNPHNPMYAHLPVRRPRRLARPDRLGQLGFRRQLDVAADHDHPECAADQSVEFRGQSAAWSAPGS